MTQLVFGLVREMVSVESQAPLGTATNKGNSLKKKKGKKGSQPLCKDFLYTVARPVKREEGDAICYHSVHLTYLSKDGSRGPEKYQHPVRLNSVGELNYPEGTLQVPSAQNNKDGRGGEQFAPT